MANDQRREAGFGEPLGLHDLAGTMSENAEALVRCGGVIADLDPGAGAFGADAPGRFGEVCRDLRRQWVSALDARTREARVRAEHLAATAAALSTAAARYLDADDDASRELNHAAPDAELANGTPDPAMGGRGGVRPADGRWPG